MYNHSEHKIKTNNLFIAIFLKENKPIFNYHYTSILLAEGGTVEKLHSGDQLGGIKTFKNNSIVIELISSIILAGQYCHIESYY